MMKEENENNPKTKKRTTKTNRKEIKLSKKKLVKSVKQLGKRGIATKKKSNRKRKKTRKVILLNECFLSFVFCRFVCHTVLSPIPGSPLKMQLVTRKSFFPDSSYVQPPQLAVKIAKYFSKLKKGREKTTLDFYFHWGKS